MPTTTNFVDSVRLAESVTTAGGTVPERLGHLIASYEVLTAPVRVDDPAMGILDAALSGKLTAAMLAKMLPDAAAKASANAYRAELAGRAANALLGQFHRELEAGGADEILDSLRPKFTEHAEAIARARSLINPESSIEHVIETGEPELITAWRQLPEHLQAIERISAVARNFAPRLGSFSQVTEYSLAENAQLADQAIMCTSGSLLGDSSLFHAPDQGGRTSPWFRAGGLRLHSIAEAQRRYDDFAAAEFDRVHASRARGGHIGSDGIVHLDEVPPNPYKPQEVSAS